MNKLRDELPVQIRNSACQRESQLHAIAVVVVISVMPPVGRRAELAELVVGQFAIPQMPVVPVHYTIATVRLGHWSNHYDLVSADLLTRRPLADRQPIAELNQHDG